MNEKCPKCGAPLEGPNEYQCGTICHQGVVMEHASCLKWQRDVLQARVAELEHALSLVVPTCDSLHHPKKYQHHAGDKCPCVRIVKEAK